MSRPKFLAKTSFKEDGNTVGFRFKQDFTLPKMKEQAKQCLI